MEFPTGIGANRAVYRNGQRRVDALTYSVEGGHDANETGRAVRVQEVRMQCQSNGSPVGGRQRRPRVTRVLWREDVRKVLGARPSIQ